MIERTTPEKKTCVTPHEAFETFVRTFLDGFEVLKLYLRRLPAKAVKASGSHFWKKSVHHETTTKQMCGEISL